MECTYTLSFFLHLILLATLSTNLNAFLHLSVIFPQQSRYAVISHLGVQSFSSLERWHGRSKGQTITFATLLLWYSFGRTRGLRWGH